MSRELPSTACQAFSPTWKHSFKTETNLRPIFRNFKVVFSAWWLIVVGRFRWGHSSDAEYKRFGGIYSAKKEKISSPQVMTHLRLYKAISKQKAIGYMKFCKKVLVLDCSLQEK